MSAIDDPHLQHHFDTPEQQFDAGKLGMWIFLATELLLFGGLFCAYAVIRSSHPDAFVWGQGLLDRKLGALNTAILLTSSATMAAAVRFAQLSKRRGLVVMLALTLLGGAGFMVVKSFEYRAKFQHGLLWARRFEPDKAHLAELAGEKPQAAAKAAVAMTGDADRGKPVFLGTCAACHGINGTGVKGQGANLAASTFVGGHDDVQLLAFVKKGRQPFDADSTMHLAMPARGGNPILKDQNLIDAIAYVRTLHIVEKPGTPAAAPVAVVAAAPAVNNDAPRLIDGTWWVPHSVIPHASAGPSGLRKAAAAPVESKVPGSAPPAGAQLFFSMYFLMTGLHGIHVLAGMGLISLLLVRSWKGDFTAAYFTPVDLGGLYWHVVDIIWIFLFPLFYLVA